MNYGTYIDYSYSQSVENLHIMIHMRHSILSEKGLCRKSNRTGIDVTFFRLPLLSYRLLSHFIFRYLLNTPESEYESIHSVRLMFGNGLRPEIWTDFTHRYRIVHVVVKQTGSTDMRKPVNNFVFKSVETFLLEPV